jgi:Flp pilus assembly protein TadD
LRASGRLNEARTALDQAVLHKPYKALYHATLGHVLMRLGQADRAAQAFDLVCSLMDGESLYNRACIAALIGEAQTAFQLLEEALSNGAIDKEWVRRDPDWEGFRDDPRYIRLVE